MTPRPNCRVPDACNAKTPGKHCKSCTIAARNKTPAMREAVRAEKLKNPCLTPEVRAMSRTPEVRHIANHNRLDNEGFWCPKPYRLLNAKLRSAKVPIEERKQIVQQAIEDDSKPRQSISFETEQERQDRFSAKIAASHERGKRGGKIGKTAPSHPSIISG